MINISKLYCDEVTPGDWLRYGEEGFGQPPLLSSKPQPRPSLNGAAGDRKTRREVVPKQAAERRPIVVWNITRACNLRCVHCYSDSGAAARYELSTNQARAVLDDLAQFGVPAVLFSGGEPLIRPDLFELIGYASQRSLRTVISTNGTLITTEVAKNIKRQGTSYVGVSLDGIGQVNDSFRGMSGAFDRAVQGIRNCQDVGVRVGLRVTLTKRNVQDLDGLFDLLEAEGIERACFYHLVPSGRGGAIADEALTHAQSREVIETILAKTRHFKQAGRKTDILTVDNHVDGVYLYLKLLKEESDRAARAKPWTGSEPPSAANVWKLLIWNGGGMYSSGVGIGCIDFNGKVHPDQFWRHYDLGDVHERCFSEIWIGEAGSDPIQGLALGDEPLLKALRNRRAHIKGRCRLCKFFEACGGSLRVRADLYFRDPWAPDPACYLSDAEIGLDAEKKEELRRSGEVFPMPD
jgi:MoaA/NifB/PqqE/SkfB family radical SAM enzyme